MNFALILICLAISSTGGILYVTVSGLSGRELSSYATLATLPNAVMIVVASLATVPAAALSTRYSRKVVFIGGAFLATMAYLIFALGMIMESFLVFLFGSLLSGFAQATTYGYRFAAAELVHTRHAGHAHSATLAGGLIASLLGPYLGLLTSNATSKPFVGSYLAATGLSAISAVLLFSVRFKQSNEARNTEISSRATSKNHVLAAYLVASGAANMMMGAMMFSYPLVTQRMHLDLVHVADVMGAHFVGMYIPGLFTGFATTRFRLNHIVIVGALIGLAAGVVALQGSSPALSMWSLFLCGVAWSLTTVATATGISHISDRRLEGKYNLVATGSFAFGSLAASILAEKLQWDGIAWVVVILMLSLVTYMHFYRSAP